MLFRYKAIDARGGESDEAAASIQIDINKFDDAPTTVVPGDTPKMGTANTANIVLQVPQNACQTVQHVTRTARGCA